MNIIFDMINLKDFIFVFLILFFVIDIIGFIFLIIDMKKWGVKIELVKVFVIVMVLMLLFLLIGCFLLSLFGVDVEFFVVVGFIIIFLLGIEMVLGIMLFWDDYLEEKIGMIVFIVFFLLVGVGIMIIILILKVKYVLIDIVLGIVFNILIVFLVLCSSDWISKKLGESGVNVFCKVFGIILLVIVIKIFWENFYFMMKVDFVELMKWF